jgi:predicted Zn finger-like uncharacterized protein
MIIQCPSCLTKFKLDDSKVKEEGTKVRCTKCKEVFLVTKEAPTPPPAPPELPEEKEEFEFAFGPSEEEGKAFGFPPPEAAPPKEEVREEAAFGAWPEEKKEEEKEEGGFEWGMTYGEVSLPEEKPEEEAPGFEYKEEEKPFEGFEFKEEAAFEAPREEVVAPPVEAPLPPPIEERVGFEEEVRPREFIEERLGFEEVPFPEFPAEAKREKRRTFLRLATYFVVICALAAVPLYLWMSYKGAETGEITLEEMNGYYAQNAEAGDIFVITGRAVNNTNKARSFFQVRGILYGGKGEKLVQKEVYCGNIFSSKELATLPRGKIEADLKNKVGGSLSNINLAPGKSVPFMVVFFDLPSGMAEFSVEVTGSQVASE